MKTQKVVYKPLFLVFSTGKLKENCPKYSNKNIPVICPKNILPNVSLLPPVIV